MPLPLNSGFLAPSLPRAEVAAVVISEAAQALKWVGRKKRFIRNPAHLGLCCVFLGILRQRLFCCHYLVFSLLCSFLPIVSLYQREGETKAHRGGDWASDREVDSGLSVCLGASPPRLFPSRDTQGPRGPKWET